MPRASPQKGKLGPRLAGVLAAMGDRFPEETAALMRANAPAMAGHARRRWLQGALAFVNHTRRAIKGDRSVAISPSLWLPVTRNDLAVYCGGHPLANRAAQTLAQPGVSGAAPPFRGTSSIPHLRWCQLRGGLFSEMGEALGSSGGGVWSALATWSERGFPLDYAGAGRVSIPISREKLAAAGRTPAGSDPTPLRRKLDALLKEQGPTFGPFEGPPFDHGIVSPILGVPKKDGSVRPVYHCSFPRLRSGGDSTTSLNGGISRASFWFPVFDSVASWLLQWCLLENPAPRSERSFVIFKLDFESAFRQVPVQEADWPLLMLHDAAGDRFLVETCAAFGTRISADLWLRVANTWKVLLHASGFPATMIYVDDLAAICPADRVWRLLDIAVTLEAETGARIHWGKVFPDGGCTSRAAVLGVIVDVGRFSLSLDPRKARARLGQARGLLAKSSWPVKDVEKLVGALNFFATALPTGRLLLGPIYALTTGGAPAVIVGPDHAARLALMIWQDLLKSSLRDSLEQPFLYAPRDVFWLATDASDAGMGGVSACGAWSAAFGGEEHWSINARELAAVWLSITYVWPQVFRGCMVHVFVDNDTARVWAGHPPSSRLSATSRALISALQRTLALHLQAAHCCIVMHRIPTHCNDVADRLSREPHNAMPQDVFLSWAQLVEKTVKRDPVQERASAWLSARQGDTPLLWWETKPTLLTNDAPPHVKYLFPDYNHCNPHSFYRRPLLHCLMQRPTKVPWHHQQLEHGVAMKLLRSQSGQEGPRR